MVQGAVLLIPWFLKQKIYESLYKSRFPIQNDFFVFIIYLPDFVIFCWIRSGDAIQNTLSKSRFRHFLSLVKNEYIYIYICIQNDMYMNKYVIRNKSLWIIYPIGIK